MDKSKKKDIAIIGMACCFPGADNITQFWENIKAAKESVTFYTKEELLAAGIDKELLENPNYVRAQGVLDDIKGFDATFFSYAPREAETMDPQHRLFLECAWSALEDAGYGNKDNEKNVGVYAGVGENNYLSKHIIPNFLANDSATEYQLMINNSKDFLSTRIAYKLNLTGPAITIQTACSTSLVAVHQACIALQIGECEMAIAGGISLISLAKEGYLYQPGMILSPDGKCRAFDKEAGGTVGGQGVGIVVLKPIDKAVKDRDHIYAIIKGSAINNDGYDKIGFAAPSPKGQAEVIKLAQQRADITADTITYVEAHGTGTALGDPVEILGLTEAFNTQKKQFCAIGSVKTNIGHLDVAAGIAGLIKAVLSLYYKTLVPSLHYKIANPNINLENTPFYVNTELKSWDKGNFSRRAGVSSFGIGGTNCHLVLEEAPVIDLYSQTKKYQLIAVSANTKSALIIAMENLSSYLHKHQQINLENIAYTLHLGRQEFKYKQFVVGNNIKDIISKLEYKEQLEHKYTPGRAVIFMFPGQGTQYINMGRQLYNNQSTFKTYIDQYISLVRKILPTNITEEDILGLSEKVNYTSVTQPALFILEYALAQYLIQLGIQPSAMIGHSIGEYVAACLGGVLSFEDALKLVVTRGQLLQGLPSGKMVAVPLIKDKIKHYLEKYQLDIAAINSNNNCIISGDNDIIKVFIEELSNNGIEYKYLHTSHAFHSYMLDPILESFRKEVNKIKLHYPTIPFISNLTGTWINNNQAVSADYWVQHLRRTVLFDQGLECLFKSKYLKNSIFLEIGPGQVLTTLAKRHPAKSNTNIILPLMRRYNEEQDDNYYLLNTLGSLWVEGININWQEFYGDKKNRISLPTYPFERKGYWISSKASYSYKKDEEIKVSNSEKAIIISMADLKDKESSKDIKIQNNASLESLITKVWQEILGIHSININDNFFNIGGDSLQAIQISGKLGRLLNTDIYSKDILENPTILQLSKLLLPRLDISLNTKGKKIASHFSSTIVHLKAGKTPNSLFLIHPISGYVFCYRELVDYLTGEQPIYGIQSPYLENERQLAGLDSIQTIASHYIKVLRTVQPEGAVSLFGSSFGGLIAYEMAYQLKCDGQEVDLLALADTGRPDHPLLSVSSANELLLRIIQLFNEKSITLAEHNLSENSKLKLLLESMNLNHLPKSQQQIIFNQVKMYCEMICNYIAKPYNGEVVFFDPIDKPADYDSITASYTWNDFVNGKITTYKVPGNHFSMIEKPHVKILATFLASYINNKIPSLI